MRDTITFLVICWLCISNGASAQVDRSSVPDSFMKKMPQENIYVHLNSTLLFPGEYLLYNLYTLHADTGKASTMSKIAYVELIGEKEGQVFIHKVNLEKGRGNSDYFVPTSIPSGKYKLVAYTNWMRNYRNNFFEEDVVIINPYQSNQRNILNRNKNASVIETPSMEEIGKGDIGKEHFELILNNQKFRKREKASIILSGNGDFEGEYSLSVRKVNELPSPERQAALSLQSANNTLPQNSDEVIFLPEIRGPILSGRAEHAISDSKVQGSITLSIPSDNYLVQIVDIREDGKFLFNLDRKNREGDAVIAYKGNDADQINIRIDEYEGLNPENLVFPEYTITPEMEENIVKRSLYNQIENAYFSAKPDTLITADKEDILPAEIVETYHLDEFTRFKTVPETFVEIIKSAWTTKTSEGRPVIEIRGFQDSRRTGQLPLVIIDGVMEQDHENLIRMDAGKIKTIKIVRDRIYFGPETFQGAVVVETLEGDYLQEHSTTGRKIEVPTTQIPKNYFRQTYNSESRKNNVPDYRHQLLWIPDLNIKDREAVIEFFTSDVEGEFEIVLEGFTGDGEAVSLKERFIVE